MYKFLVGPQNFNPGFHKILHGLVPALAYAHVQAHGIQEGPSHVSAHGLDICNFKFMY